MIDSPTGKSPEARHAEQAATLGVMINVKEARSQAVSEMDIQINRSNVLRVQEGIFIIESYEDGEMTNGATVE
jgi:hypothetical protein